MYSIVMRTKQFILFLWETCSLPPIKYTWGKWTNSMIWWILRKWLRIRGIKTIGRRDDEDCDNLETVPGETVSGDQATLPVPPLLSEMSLASLWSARAHPLQLFQGDVVAVPFVLYLAPTCWIICNQYISMLMLVSPKTRKIKCLRPALLSAATLLLYSPLQDFPKLCC